jgi:UDP-N-acetylglucosamine:LPS N-acetylglucosamine transferase
MKVFFKITLFFVSLAIFGQQPEKILIVYTEAGGGHIATALALKSALEEKYEKAEITLINGGDYVGNFLENARFKGLEKIYTQNLGSPMGRFFNRIYGDWIINPITKLLEYLSLRQIIAEKENHPIIRFLKKENPDLVISTASFINKHIKTLLEYGDIKAPFIVVMSDFDEAQEVMWTRPGNGTHYIIRTNASLKNQIDPKYLFPISGMCIRPTFYPEKLKSFKVFEAMGLSITKPTALVAFGGYGSEEMKDLLHFFNLNSDLQAIFICGGNKKLFTQLKENAGPNSKILGFVDNIHEYMQACHLFIGKPGPGMVTESVHCHLPLFLKSGMDLMKQEEGVLNWVLEEKFGDKWDTFEEFQEKFGKVLSHMHLYKKNIEKTARKNPTVEAIEHIDYIFKETFPDIPQAKVANYTFY